jgi:hypothetical protein
MSVTSVSLAEEQYWRSVPFVSNTGTCAVWLAVVPFERAPRAAGETKYPLFKMLRFAWTGVSSFSAFPLRISIAAGCILSCAGFLYLLRVVYMALWTTSLVPGWASVVALQCAFSGMILLALGAVGDYVARTYEETKSRPLYVVTETCNVALTRPSISRALILAEPCLFSDATVNDNAFSDAPADTSFYVTLGGGRG